MGKMIIISDLDETLLDQVTYSHLEASPALARIRELGVPLIFCSSKTRAEIEEYRHRLNNDHPFISENGGGIFIPKGYFPQPVDATELKDYWLIALGTPYEEILRSFARLRRRFPVHVRGFADMTCEEVAELTGLSWAEAKLAKMRDFDEPFIFEMASDERFLRAIELSNLRWTQGRIFHIMGNHDKGRAVNILMSLYREQYGSVTSIGLGDSLNDLPMLKVVDKPVLVRHQDGSCDARIDIPDIMKTRLPGPAGWNETVLQLLAQSGNSHVLPEQKNLLAIFNAALAAVDPYNAVLNAARVENGQLHLSGAQYNLAAFNRIIVVGAGKATARMALAVESLLGNKITEGLIIVKDGHTAPLSIIEQVEASHPVPSEAGIAGTQRILQLANAADEKTLVICLLSGGASALLVAPAAGLTLQDKQDATKLLLNAGASINELNAVRKHLSMVKGGRLAWSVYPAQMLTLILSDVIGDPLDVIASGPTAPDNSTYAEALAVIANYGLQEQLPPRVIEYLQSGIAGTALETVKANDHCLDTTHNLIVASIRQALAAAEEQAIQLGYVTKIFSATLQGEARDVALLLAQTTHDKLSGMKSGESCCLLSGGETTVTVHGTGKGGRNQELALAFAVEIDGDQHVSLLSAGTDGGDGSNDAAGAIVDGGTASLALSLGIDPRKHLDDNDSYTFFQELDAEAGTHSHLKTGPTGTNVMDIQIVLLKSGNSSVG